MFLISCFHTAVEIFAEVIASLSIFPVPTDSAPSLASVTAFFARAALVTASLAIFEPVTAPAPRSALTTPPFLIFPEVTAWVLIFALVTACLAMLTALTWFGFSFTAAYAVPPRAMNRAMQDKTLATVRCRFRLVTGWTRFPGRFQPTSVGW